MIRQFCWTSASTPRMAYTARYEPFQPYLFLALAGEIKARYVADVGANVGFYSLLSTTLPDVEKIVGFEPAPECFAAYKANIALNGLDSRILAVPKAASDEPGQRPFHIVAWDAGTNSIEQPHIARHGMEARERREVECTTLDRELTWRNMPIAIKIDVEGHELSTLSGASELLANNTAVAQIEHNGNDAEVIRAMADVGYSLIFDVRRDLYFTNVPDLMQEKNILACVRRAMGSATATSLRRPVQIPRKPRNLWRFLVKKPFYF